MADTRKLRIMIVDDDETARKMHKALLERAPDQNYDFVETQSCAQALEECLREPPDCILLDYTMPEMDGIIFFKKLQHAGLQHVPVILVTASGSESLAVHAFKTGVQDYLRKDRLTTATLSQAIQFSIYKKRAEQAVLQREFDVQQRMDEINSLHSKVTHDLKSPLMTIETFIKYLERDIAANRVEAVASDISHLKTATQRMFDIIKGMLDVSRVDHPQRTMSSLTLQEVVNDALGAVAGRIAQNKVRVNITVEPIRLYGDRLELVCLLQNLIDNAVKFMDDQPEPVIDIGAESRDGETVIFVRDNGRGIEQQNRDKLFNMFEKLDDSGSGSGIGLALAMNVVEAHDGRIWVESEGPNKGSCFCFVLPQEVVPG